MGRDLGAFLRRIGVDRVHAPELGRNDAEQAQLAGDPPRAGVAAGAGFLERIGVNELPDARNQVGGVLRQQGVQKGGARAGEAGDEDWPFDRLIEYLRRPFLFFAEPQQVGQEAQRIPASREPPEEG